MSIVKTAKKAIKKTGLHEPLRKLLSASYRHECALTKQLISDIHQRGFERIRHKHAASRDTSRKYLNLEWHMTEVTHLLGKLRLLKSAPLRVLDIGCGSGCFLFALKSRGHDVLGIDLAETPLYNDMVRLLEVPRIVHRVERFRRLPELGKPLDLITAFSICFDLHWTDDVWGTKEWKFFLDDCRSRLKPGGKLFLNFNPATTRDFRFVPDDVAEMLRTLPGGNLSPSKEFFTLVACES